MPPKKLTIVIIDHEGNKYNLEFTNEVDELYNMRPLFYGNSPIRGVVTGNIVKVNKNLEKIMNSLENINIINKLTRFAAGKYAKPPLTLELGIDNTEISRLTAESKTLMAELNAAANGRYVSSEWSNKINFTKTMFSFYTDTYGNNLRLFEFLDENFKAIMDLDPRSTTDITLKGVSYGAIYASEQRVKGTGLSNYSASSIGGAHFGSIIEASDAPPPSSMATARSTPNPTILDDVCLQIISEHNPTNERLKDFFGYKVGESVSGLKKRILYRMKAVDFDFTLVEKWGANPGEIYGVFDVTKKPDRAELSEITSLVMETLVKATLYLNQNCKHILIPDKNLTLTLYTLSGVEFTVQIDIDSLAFKSRSSFLRPQPTPGTSLVSLDVIYKLEVNDEILDYQSNMVDLLIAKSSISVVKTPNAGTFKYNAGIISTVIPRAVPKQCDSSEEAENYADYLGRLLAIRGGTRVKVDTTQIRVDLMALLMENGAGPKFKDLLEHHKVQVNAGFMRFLLRKPHDKITELLNEVGSRVKKLSEPGDLTKTKVSMYVSPNVSIDAVIASMSSTPEETHWIMHKFSIPPKECVSIRKKKDTAPAKAVKVHDDREQKDAGDDRKQKDAGDDREQKDAGGDADADSPFGWTTPQPDFTEEISEMVDNLKQSEFLPSSPVLKPRSGFMATLGSPSSPLSLKPRSDSPFLPPPRSDFESEWSDEEAKDDWRKGGGKSTRKTRNKTTKRNPRKLKRNKTRKRKPLRHARTKSKR